VLRLADDFSAPQIAHVVERSLRDATLVTHLPGRLVIVEADRVRIRPALP